MPRKLKQPEPPARRERGAWSIDWVVRRRRWRVRPPASVDPKRTPTYFLTREEAEAWTTEQRARTARGPLVLADDVTLADYLEWWIDTTGPPRRWSVATIKLYESYTRRAGPLLDVSLRALTRDRFQARINELLRAGPRLYKKPPLRRPLSADSVLGTVRAWRAALADAVGRYHLIAANPTDELLLPDPDRDEADAWTQDEAELLAASIGGHRHEAIFALLLGGGFRIGEVLAHRWTDVDWQRNRIFTRATGTFEVQEHTKTRRRRWVPLPPPVMAILKLHRTRQTWDAEFISEHAPGRRWGYTTVRADLRALCLKIGINPYGTHAARHHAASYMQERGMPLAALARVLGNTPGTLSKRYLHASERAIDQAGAIMSGLFPEPESTASENDPG